MMIRMPGFDLNNHDDRHDLDLDVDDQDAFLVWEEEAAGGIPVVRLPARIVILILILVTLIFILVTLIVMIFIQPGLQILKTKPLQADNIWKPDVILYNNADRFDPPSVLHNHATGFGWGLHFGICNKFFLGCSSYMS